MEWAAVADTAPLLVVDRLHAVDSLHAMGCDEPDPPQYQSPSCLFHPCSFSGPSFGCLGL